MPRLRTSRSRALPRKAPRCLNPASLRKSDLGHLTRAPPPGTRSDQLNLEHGGTHDHSAGADEGEKQKLGREVMAAALFRPAPLGTQAWEANPLGRALRNRPDGQLR